MHYAAGISQRRHRSLSRRTSRAVAALCAACAIGATPAAAGGLLSEPRAWESVGLPFEAEPVFSFTPGAVLGIEGRDAVGFLYRPIEAEEATALTWQWRVDIGPPPVDLAAPGDDRPLAVHLWFPGEEQAFSARSLAMGLLGVPKVGYAITYVWGGTRGADAVLDNAYFDKGKIVVLRPGRTPEGQWRAERVDFRADFERLFGRPAPDPAFIAVSSDADDRGGRVSAWLSGLALQPATAAE